MPGNRRKSRLNSRRGTAMVEAAVVFPLAMAAVMAAVYLMINLYSFTALRSSLHLALRAEVNAETGLASADITDGRVYDRYRLAAERRGISFTRDREGLLAPCAAAEEVRVYRGNGMIKGGVKKRHFGRYYILDEVGALRNLALAKAVTGGG